MYSNTYYKRTVSNSGKNVRFSLSGKLGHFDSMSDNHWLSGSTKKEIIRSQSGITHKDKIAILECSLN